MTARKTLRIALAQLNPTVGDVAGNAAKVREARAEAAGLGADVVMFPELFLAGYPPEDLVLKPAFQDVCREACEALARETGDGGPAVLVGLPWAEDGGLYNAYALLDAGQIAALRFKVDLPNYGVFDEKRVFTPGPLPGPVVIRGVGIGIPVCEDIWGDETDERMNIAAARVTESGLPLVYLNQVCGQDELVFDGASFVVNADGALACQMPAFREAVALTVWEKDGEGWRCREAPLEVVEEADDAECAERLGVRYDTVQISGPVEGFEAALKPLFAGKPRDITEENLQARTRGTILMSISNKFGPMVVTTGNKSEMSVGYATLYGDMNGGYNPVKDLYKMEVYRLSALRNRWKPAGALGPDGVAIPENIIAKAPTAELRENQKDQDSLPPYDVLDDILECLVEREMRVCEVVARGHDLETVKKIERLLYLAEYKRRQAAPGVKVTRKNFGRDRRYPIVNRFRDQGQVAFRPDEALQQAAGKARSEAYEA